MNFPSFVIKVDYLDGILFDVQYFEETDPGDFESTFIAEDKKIQPFIDKRNDNLNLKGIELKVTTADDVSNI